MPDLVADLRSDTVTRPSPGMRRAIYEAEVGDDQYGEDPSVNRLQEEVAGLLGKEAALFLPTGTMADQVALRTLTRPGDSVLVPWQSHVELHETGGAAANAGVQLLVAGDAARHGLYDVKDLLAAVLPPGHMLYPPTTLVWIENPHNRGGGVVFPKADVDEICATAHDRGIRTFCDGARLLNAAVASGRLAAELADAVRPRQPRPVEGTGLPGRLDACRIRRVDRGGSPPSADAGRGHAAGRHSWPLPGSTPWSTTCSTSGKTMRTRASSPSG